MAQDRQHKEAIMTIKEAKEEIIHTVTSYLSKDKFGRYEIPPNKQRPIFLIGPPGIGKTEIMAQVASELGIGLISYSMTHHTRQSALGLPLIKQKEYDGVTYDISEYTMSDIIASVYEMMKKSGLKNGLLFLDEINCVSETLTPIMLQFLQYKVFGSHSVPEGWIVVTAGNPPEYNNSVHEFDIVTWDRLKRIDVEPDLQVWKEFAYQNNVHPAIITYLDIKPQNFYKIENTVDGKHFVTARGWDDLSRIILQYEKHQIKVTQNVVGQYLQNKKIARDFAIYYDLYQKYKSDYQVNEILAGKADPSIVKRAQDAAFDERYALLGLLLEVLGQDAKNVIMQEKLLTILQIQLKEFKVDVQNKAAVDLLEGYINTVNKEKKKLETTNALSKEQSDIFMMQIKMLETYLDTVRHSTDDPFATVKAAYGMDVAEYQKCCASAKLHFQNAFRYCDDAFGKNGQELLILVTELAANQFCAQYIAKNGCPEYYAHDKELMFHERNLELITEIEKLNFDL